MAAVRHKESSFSNIHLFPGGLAETRWNQLICCYQKGLFEIQAAGATISRWIPRATSLITTQVAFCLSRSSWAEAQTEEIAVLSAKTFLLWTGQCNEWIKQIWFCHPLFKTNSLLWPRPYPINPRHAPSWQRIVAWFLKFQAKLACRRPWCFQFSNCQHNSRDKVLKIETLGLWLAETFMIDQAWWMPVPA